MPFGPWWLTGVIGAQLRRQGFTHRGISPKNLCFTGVGKRIGRMGLLPSGSSNSGAGPRSPQKWLRKTVLSITRGEHSEGVLVGYK